MRILRALVFLWLVVVASPARAAAPTLDEGRALLSRGELDELYLKFAAVKKGSHPSGDAKVAQLLGDAARAAVDRKDPSLALGLSDKARALDPRNLVACLAAADAALSLDQRGVAEEALEQAHAAAPKDADLTFRLAVFLEQEGAYDRARAMYLLVPRTSPRGSDAATLAARLVDRQNQQKGDLDAIRQNEEEAARRRAQAGSGGLPEDDAPPPSAPEKTLEVRDATTSKDRVQGLEARASTNFRIVYSSRGRDFAQRAGYEQRLLDLFERARQKVQAIVGRATAKPLDVVLYTREEFQAEFGGSFANAVAGFYGAGKIRMNASEDVDDGFFETAAHEYTHAVVDDADGKGGVSRWFHEGFAEWVGRRSAAVELVNARERQLFGEAWHTGGLPKLRAYDDGPIVGRGVQSHLAYLKAACALDVLMKGSGTTGVLRALGEISRGARFYDAIAHEYGKNRMDVLDAEAEKACGG